MRAASRPQHLHRDDCPRALAVLDVLFGHRQDREALGYRPDKHGAEVDWDLLTGGVLSSTEVAAVHVARGCAIAERHGGLPPGIAAVVTAAATRALAGRTWVGPL
jgi:hypothetical protein